MLHFDCTTLIHERNQEHRLSSIKRICDQEVGGCQESQREGSLSLHTKVQ